MKILIDENLSEYLAEGLNSIQYPLDNNIHIVSMAKTFGKGVKDDDWIPAWGKADGIFLTQDLNISRTRSLCQLLIENKMGSFFLSVSNKTSYWERVRVIIKHWPEIANLICSKKKPYAYKVTNNKVEKMQL